jgi:hypothetical protein
MAEHQDNSLSDSAQNSLPLTEQSEVSILSEQHVTPSTTTLGVSVVKGKDKSAYTFSFHWTVRLKVTKMTDREAAILLKVITVQSLLNGLDFTGYIALEYLTSYLLRGKTDPLEIREERDRQACLLGTLLLTSMRGGWITLSDRVKLSPAIVQDISETGWLPNQRTFNSWVQYHQPRSFLEILTVPLEQYGERDTSTTRYSGYTKGYGNGGHVSRTKKTAYDSELDGESTEREPPEFSLLEVRQYNQLLLAIEREKIERLYQQK